jgi:chromosome segregation ATPase
MSFADLRRSLRGHWRAFNEVLWPPTPCEQRQTDLDLIAEELRQRQERLLQRRQRIESLRGRLAQRERRLALLSARVQDCVDRADDANAGRAIQALERQRRLAESLRERISRQEQAYERQLRVFAWWKRRRAELRG